MQCHSYSYLHSSSNSLIILLIHHISLPYDNSLLSSSTHTPHTHTNANVDYQASLKGRLIIKMNTLVIFFELEIGGAILRVNLKSYAVSTHLTKVLRIGNTSSAMNICLEDFSVKQETCTQLEEDQIAMLNEVLFVNTAYTQVS